MLIPSFGSRLGKVEVFPHAGFELLYCGDCCSGIWKQNAFVRGVLVDTDHAIADSMPNPGTGNLRHLRQLGSASQTVKVFRNEGLLFPSRLHNGDTLFRPLTASTAMRVLNNPRYAGAYTYGRRQFRRTIDGKRTLRARDIDDWPACIPDAHPGYISWERHQENLKILKANGRGFEAARASIPREGPALLQGRAVCGQCGSHLRVRYAARRGRQEAWYICNRARIYRGEPMCQSIAGPPVDEAIGMLIAEQMTPAAVELALEVRKEIQARHEEADRLRCRAIERAQTEAELAQRRFMLVDPSNRLVADTLEGEWNEKLRTLASAREERERGREHDQFILDKAVHERLVAMTADFNELWKDPDTPSRERRSRDMPTTGTTAYTRSPMETCRGSNAADGTNLKIAMLRADKRKLSQKHQLARKEV
ncbi:hypothetical protein GGE07_005484 [Sinorhizobium terangae]|uniref:recombinase family protein n=1 Tax=Sinorhizobium terangae TaxID=110322 RepID=UPI0017AB039F|nr:recombinase family protein [Sinorhizobium terangae]MBB4188805.1 hypothetical protein [Sinorhizobium terangae]